MQNTKLPFNEQQRGYSLVQIIQGLLFRKGLCGSPGVTRIYAPAPLRGWGRNTGNTNTYLQVKSGNTPECDGHTLRNLLLGGRLGCVSIWTLLYPLSYIPWRGKGDNESYRKGVMEVMPRMAAAGRVIASTKFGMCSRVLPSSSSSCPPCHSNGRGERHF